MNRVSTIRSHREFTKAQRAFVKGLAIGLNGHALQRDSLARICASFARTQGIEVKVEAVHDLLAQEKRKKKRPRNKKGQPLHKARRCVQCH